RRIREALAPQVAGWLMSRPPQGRALPKVDKPGGAPPAARRTSAPSRRWLVCPPRLCTCFGGLVAECYEDDRACGRRCSRQGATMVFWLWPTRRWAREGRAGRERWGRSRARGRWREPATPQTAPRPLRPAP